MKETKNKLKEKPDTKKLFTVGGKAGPGRGHKKVKADEVDTRDPLELAMSIIKQDLKSKEVTVRQKAVSMLVAITKLKQAIRKPYAESLSPPMQRIIMSLADGRAELDDSELAEFIELICDDDEGPVGGDTSGSK